MQFDGYLAIFVNKILDYSDNMCDNIDKQHKVASI